MAQPQPWRGMSHTKRTLTASEFETSPNGDSYRGHLRHFVGATPDLKSTFDHVVDNLHLFTHYPRHLSPQIISPIILPHRHRTYSRVARKHASMAIPEDHASPNDIYESFFRHTSRRWM